MIDALLDQALRALHMGAPERAVELLRQALTSDPENAHAHALLSICLYRAKRLEAAVYEARQAVQLDPSLAAGHLAMGIALTARRDFARAEDHLAQARAQALEESSDVHLAFASLYHFQGRFDEELRELEHARTQAPDDADVLAALGEVYRERSRPREAEEAAREALGQEPEHAAALVLMGQLLLASGKVAEARDHALWVLQSDAGHVGALYLLTEIKSRESKLLGLWWRYHSFLNRLGETKATLVLLAGYILYRLFTVVLLQHEHTEGAAWLSNLWLAFCLYTWTGPVLFRRSIDKELNQVELKDF